MALFDVVNRLLNKAGDAFVEPRREDGHGSSAVNPTHVTGSVIALDSAEENHLHKTAVVTSAGDTTVLTPSSGKALVIKWIYAINNPNADTTPLITVTVGGVEKYKVYALSKRQTITAGLNESVVINLSVPGSVAVTIIYEEV